MKKHEIICDRCDKRADLVKTDNFPYYKTPNDWFEVNLLSESIGSIDWNLCEECGQRALERKRPDTEEQK